ncbi:hypothetical protein, partial [Pantoea ananatis]|uniref:hypothetical protein n=1 Tax=Pantoea ananas TaxID=553 RepID=UPI001B30642E
MTDFEIKSSNEYVAEYVCTSNEFTATGIRFLLRKIGKSGLRIKNHVELQKIKELNKLQNWRLIMSIPAEPLLLLSKLGSLKSLIYCSEKPPSILLLSDLPQKWIISTLESLGCSSKMLINIIVLPGKAECSLITSFLSGKIESYTSLYHDNLRHNLYPVLTLKEYEAVSRWLTGYSLQESATLSCRSVNTVYVQRYNGLHKLSAIFP